MAKASKTVFVCQACGCQVPRWMGKCPECGQWDSLVEERQTRTGAAGAAAVAVKNQPVAVDQVIRDREDRFTTGIGEFDRVLGGGLVPGSLVLIGGDPGIGKSTLMLQVLHGLATLGRRVLYVSGEESVQQLGLRSRRLGTLSGNLLVVAETDLDSIVPMLDNVAPGVLVVDSIQTMFNEGLSSVPGSVSQVREAAMRLMLVAKKTGIPTFLVGHVTKEGAIAGPRLLEHMVDTVLYFEGDRQHLFRILRAVKNRFGSTNEIGVFEMGEKGLTPVGNPSAIFLSERSINAPGSVVTTCMEGTRPILMELQALVSSTNFGTPRRTILGLDANRVALLVAVMEKKLGLHLMGHDIFMNVAGGMRVDEPAVDVGIVSAVASSFLDQPVQEHTLVCGEIGLTGEVRAVGQLDSRLAEAAKMGFTRCLVPRSNLRQVTRVEGLRVEGAATVSDVIEALF